MSVMEKIKEKAHKIVSSEDITGVKKDILRQLVDNQVYELEKIKEKTTTADIDRIANVFLPAIKKIVRDSIIEEIVGVQPMKAGLPTALVQYIDFVYNAGAHAGESVIDGPVTTDYSNSPGEGATITNGIDVKVKTKSADIRSRKLLSSWTFEGDEAAQFMGVNLEKEITKALAGKITEEINYEIINLLYANASGGTTNWSMPAPADAPAVKDRKEKELFYAIEDVCEAIFNKTGRYPNYLIVSPTIRAILRRNGEYISLNRENMKVARLFQQGFLEDLGMKIYVVRSLSTNDILVGWKGDSELEAGLIYAPQSTFKITNTFFNVEKWEFMKSVGTTYAIADVEYNVYGKVQVT